MSAQALTIDGKNLVFGLNWLVLDPMESKHLQIQDWRFERGYEWAVTQKFKGDQFYGLAQNDFHYPDKGGAYSGAVLIAQHPKAKGKTTLVLLELEGDYCAVVGLIRGNVVHDAICAKHELGSHRATYQAKLAEQGLVNQAATLGTESMVAESADVLTWQDVVKRIGKFSFSDDAKIKRFKSDRSALVMIVLLAVALLAGIGMMVKSSLDAKAQRMAKLAQEQSNNPTAKYDAEAQKLLARGDAFVPVTAGLTAIASHVGSVPLHLSGWTLKDINCDVTVSECVGGFTRDADGLGTFDSFMKAKPEGWKNVTIQNKGGVIDVKWLVAIKRQPLPKQDTWPTYQDFLVKEGSRWQRYGNIGFNVTIKDPLIQGVPNGVPSSVAETLPSAVFAASWSTSEKPWWMREGLTTEASNMDLQNVKLKFNGSQITFSAEGKAYVRKSSN